MGGLLVGRRGTAEDGGAGGDDDGVQGKGIDARGLDLRLLPILLTLSPFPRRHSARARRLPFLRHFPLHCVCGARTSARYQGSSTVFGQWAMGNFRFRTKELRGAALLRLKFCRPFLVDCPRTWGSEFKQTRRVTFVMSFCIVPRELYSFPAS